MNADERLQGEGARHPCPLLFATISGAHLYGFPSPDSDYDLRGCHVLPMEEVVGLDAGRETVELPISALNPRGFGSWPQSVGRAGPAPTA